MLKTVQSKYFRLEHVFQIILLMLLFVLYSLLPKIIIKFQPFSTKQSRFLFISLKINKILLFLLAVLEGNIILGKINILINLSTTNLQ